MRVCRFCGAELSPGSNACERCGRSVETSQASGPANGPARTPPRYPTRKLAAWVIAGVLLTTTVLVITLSQVPAQVGSGQNETVPTPAPATSARGIVVAHIGADRVLDVTQLPDRSAAGRQLVIVAFHAGGASSHPAVLAAIRTDVLTLARALYTSAIPIGKLTLLAETTYENGNGDYSWCRVVQVSLAQHTAGEVKWNKVSAQELWRWVQVESGPQFCR